MQPYVHLHVHSQYSLLDGQASISALVNKAIKNGMRGIALTDHGNMFGIKELFDICNKKNGDYNKAIKSLKKRIKDIKEGNEEAEDKEAIIADIEKEIADTEKKLFKPILGCEMYVARNGLLKKNGREDQSGYHLVVLAKNNTGYHNLIKLVSKAWTEGYYMRPRTDRAELEKYHEGLIVCSACLGGEIPKKITNGDIAGAEEAVLWFKNLFGEDYYLELQRHKATVPRANHEAYPLQENVNKYLIEFSRKHNIKLVCTNDVHFVDEENAEAHDHLICLSTGKDLDDPKRMLYTKQEWMKTQEEMNELFSDIPEALSNTVEVLDKVEVYNIEHDPILPNFPLPEGFSDDNDYLRYLTMEGAKKRWGTLTEEQQERVDFELNTIKSMGFPGYFLIVQDFIAAARNMGVSVGPGRGSAAGSAVAYCLGITQIDPIQYDLLFERFLNPDRISLPDIDIDFDDDGRGEVLQWVTDKYGYEKVAHIITYGTMATKLSVKDVARVQKLPLSESNRLAKLIPDKIPDTKKITLQAAIDYVPELKQAEESSNPQLSNTLKYAKMLEGNVRNTGVHACGVIIGRDDITDWVPVSTADDKVTGEKMLVTQYEGSVIESTGLIKMDFLGLKTLSIIKDAVENISISKHIDVDIDNISIEDPKTYELYCAGKTTGTFQFESAGMQKYLRELHPSTFEDLIAMNALYRPGPMDYIPQFIARKHGREPIEYDIPIMEKYLKDTYGITVYQEQVMLLSRLLANFTRGQSDGLRKAMGKKLRDKLDALKPLFINGGVSNGHDPKVLEKIWGDWEKFASYAFNKSHATCYSWVAFQTAYLKANFPAEYMAAVLSRNLNDLTEVTKYMDECKSMKIQVLGPDVNESLSKFSVNNHGDIRFGLAAIKGVGEAAVQAIIQEREANGPYKSVFDFVERVNLSACNKKNIESLAIAGAFDAFSETKREVFDASCMNTKGEPFLDSLVRYGQKVQADKMMQTNSLFGDIAPISTATPEVPYAESWPDLIRLDKERELVGMYLSAHPLDTYALELEYGCNTRMIELKDREALENKDITFGGIVIDYRTALTKKGTSCGFLKIEDYSGAEELALFGQDFIDYGKYGINGMFILVHARCQRSRYNPDRVDLKITSIELLQDVKDKLLHSLTINMSIDAVNRGIIKSLSDFLPAAHQHKSDLYFQIYDPEHKKSVKLRSSRRPRITKELIDFLKENEDISFKINN